MSLRDILISVLVGKSSGVGLVDSTVALTLTYLESSLVFSHSGATFLTASPRI